MSNSTSDISTPWHLWVVGGLLLLWGSIGAFDYLATVLRYEPYLSKFPEEALAYYFNAPLSMFVMWGASALGGFFGAVFLLMRKKIAVPIFGVSWFCSVVAVIYAFINPAPGVAASNLFMITVIFITLLILIYIYWLQKRDVLR